MFFDAAMPRSRIIGTGSYLPERVVSNAELEQRLDTSAGWIRQHTGIERRHVAAATEATSDLAVAAARQAIASSGLTVADLDLIIVATSTPDSPLPSCAAHVQHKLGADLIPAFDLNASAAGFLYALTVADQFVAAGTYNTVLVVGADVMSRVLRPGDRTGGVLFGDGAGAVVLVPAIDERRGILSSKIHADGSMAPLMHIAGGGSAEPLTEQSVTEGRQFVQLDGKRLYAVSIRHMTSYSMQALKAARLTSAELDWVVPQQANINIVRTISERLGFPLDRFVLDIAEHGNTLSASVPISLDLAMRDGRIEPEQTALVCALGAGLCWGAMIIRL